MMKTLFLFLSNLLFISQGQLQTDITEDKADVSMLAYLEGSYSSEEQSKQDTFTYHTRHKTDMGR